MTGPSEQVCVSCALESCFTCENPSETKCCCGGTFFKVFTADPTNLPDNNAFPREKPILHAMQEILEQTPGRGRPRLSDDELSNPEKGGRLRAQREFPIPEGTKCEWANLAKAGGGVVPVVGCMGSAAVARHHGPDKSTLNNVAKINVHLICATCHNRWHTLNDPYYDPSGRPDDGLPFVPVEPFAPHDSETLSTPELQFANEIWWTTKPAKRKTPTPPSLEPVE